MTNLNKKTLSVALKIIKNKISSWEVILKISRKKIIRKKTNSNKTTNLIGGNFKILKKKKENKINHINNIYIHNMILYFTKVIFLYKLI